MLICFAEYPVRPDGTIIPVEAGTVDEAIALVRRVHGIGLVAGPVAGRQGATDGLRDFLVLRGEAGVEELILLMRREGSLAEDGLQG